MLAIKHGVIQQNDLAVSLEKCHEPALKQNQQIHKIFESYGKRGIIQPFPYPFFPEDSRNTKEGP